MKTIRSWSAVVLLAGALSSSVDGLGQAAAATNRPAASPVPASSLPPSPVVPPSVAAPPPVAVPTGVPVPSVTQPPISAADKPEAVGVEVPVIVTTTTSPIVEPGEDTQRRLEAPTPEVLMEKYGSVGFLIRQPEPRNFLEMINPFAPATFGGKRREIYNKDPNLKPGASLPRNFIRDGIRNEPDINLISWPW